MIDIEIVKTEDNLDIFRNLYFNSLTESQQYYIELLINPDKELNLKSSTKYIIKNKKEEIGYCIINEEKIMLEFYLIDNFIPICEDIFKYLIKKLSVKKALCKSFDNVFLKCCITHHKNLKLEEALFRDIIEKDVDIPYPDINFRIGKIEDFPAIDPFKDGAFENDDELKLFLKEKKTIIYEIDDEIIGCGMFCQIIKGRPEFDIGMAIHPKYRRKGFGTYIINHLKNYCLKNNWRPICECSVENIESRRTLEKAGFISKHNLIEFEF